MTITFFKLKYFTKFCGYLVTYFLFLSWIWSKVSLEGLSMIIILILILFIYMINSLHKALIVSFPSSSTIWEFLTNFPTLMNEKTKIPQNSDALQFWQSAMGSHLSSIQ